MREESRRLRIASNMPDTFEHDRAAIIDGVERIGPTRPSRSSRVRGEVRVLSAVVVVDVGGPRGDGRRRGFRTRRSRDVGVAGVEREGQSGAVQLGDEVGEVGHPTARGGRPAACSRRRGSRPGLVRGRPARSEPRQGVATGRRPARGRRGRRDGRPGTAAGLGQPVDAALQVVDRARCGRRVATAEVDPRCPDRLAPPAAVGAWIARPGVGDLGAQRPRGRDSFASRGGFPGPRRRADVPVRVPR